MCLPEALANHKRRVLHWGRSHWLLSIKLLNKFYVFYSCKFDGAWLIAHRCLLPVPSCVFNEQEKGYDPGQVSHTQPTLKALCQSISMITLLTSLTQQMCHCVDETLFALLIDFTLPNILAH